MEIKDLVGLSKPLTRLIDVISQGIGAVTRPYLIRKNAEAKADEVRIISCALKDVAEQHHLPVVFNDGKVEIWQKPEDKTLVLEHVDGSVRTAQRLEYQQRKRQKNIEDITSIAATELLGETEVPDDPPDEDWISRFFSNAEDVSSEQMQELWGRILAGEVKKPGSYSLKTLDFIRNMTKADAALLERVGKLALNYSGAALLATHDLEWLRTERDIYPGHHFAIGELGAMYPTDLTIQVFNKPSSGQVIFVSGKFVLIVDRGSILDKVPLPIWNFTKIGQELLQLITREGDEAYLQTLGRFFLSRGAKAKIADVIGHVSDGNVRYEKARDVTPE